MEYLRKFKKRKKKMFSPLFPLFLDSNENHLMHWTQVKLLKITELRKNPLKLYLLILSNELTTYVLSIY